MTDNDTPFDTAALPQDTSTPATETAPTPTADAAPEQAAAEGEGPARNRPRRGRRGGARNAERGEGQPRAQEATTGNDGAPPANKPQRNREIHPALQKLFTLYPKMFGARFLPLKLGVFQELLAAHPDDFKKDELKVALGLHARSTRYLESVAAGLPRHDLQGQPLEPVAPEHVHHAILEIFRRRQLRAKNDLRPHLIAQILTAIEASGIAPDDYALAVRTPDEAASTALDEAIAEVKRVSAKSVALVRAFEASGKSLAEFAEMYGMNADDISDAVARVRRQSQVQAVA